MVFDTIYKAQTGLPESSRTLDFIYSYISKRGYLDDNKIFEENLGTILKTYRGLTALGEFGLNNKNMSDLL